VKRLFLGSIALMLLAGCPSPSTYGTPRTVKPGLLSHTVSIEVLGIAGTKAGSDALPTIPSYTLRIGLAPRVDMGFRAASFTSPAFDVKWNFLRTKYFDIAADPGAQWFYDRANDVHYLYLNAPVMFGFNVRYDLTLVFVPAFALQATTRDTLQPCPNNMPAMPPCGSELTRLLGPTAPIARAGFGVNWRLFRDFAVQPEITVSRQIGGFDGWIVNGGIGVSFVHLPSFSDFNDEEDLY